MRVNGTPVGPGSWSSDTLPAGRYTVQARAQIERALTGDAGYVADPDGTTEEGTTRYGEVAVPLPQE